jgi:hypothetical protein
MCGVWAGTEHRGFAHSLSHSVPKAWGVCRGGTMGALIFEDEYGTVRIVNLVTWNVDFLVTRQ